MGQCQSNCKRAIPETASTAEVIHKTNKASSTTLVKSHPPSTIYTSFPLQTTKDIGVVNPQATSLHTPSTASLNSRSTPASTYQEDSLTPSMEEPKHFTNVRSSKNKKRVRRKINSSEMSEAYPSTSKGPAASFTPVLSLNASCKVAFIPEEKDPDAPSDEEEDHRDVELRKKLEEPHMRYQRHTWIHTAKSGVSPISINLPSLPPVPPENKAVHPDALSHFQKLKIAAEVAAKHNKRQQRINAEEQRIQDIYDQRQRWTDYEAIQSSTGEKGQDIKSLSRRKRDNKNDHSFDLSDTESWYFDFQAHDFDTEGRGIEVDPYCDDDSTSQASLSLLSQASMEAQRRLFAAKAQGRGKEEYRTTLFSSDSVNGRNLRSTRSISHNDYGPQQKLTPGISCVDTIEGLELEFTSQIGMRSSMDRSCVSDIADACSVSTSTIFTGASNNDYRVARRKRRINATQSDDHDSRNSVDPRFEETLKAVKAGEIVPDDRVIRSGSSLSSRLDKIEKHLASIEKTYDPEEKAVRISIPQSFVMNRSRNSHEICTTLESGAEKSLVSGKEQRSTSHVTPADSPINVISPAQIKYRQATPHESMEKGAIVDAKLNAPQETNSKSMSNPIIKPRNTAQRIQHLSQLVLKDKESNNVPHNVSDNKKILLNGTRSPLHAETFRGKILRCSTVTNIQRGIENENLGCERSVCQKKSRAPLVSDPSSEQFLQFSETYRRTSPHSASLDEDLSLHSDSSSISDFGEIRRMESNKKDRRKSNQDLTDFADSSLMRAEKVEAQVKDVLTKYRENSS